VVWDLFMVYLAIVNVSLIIFDLTYLWMRPFYSRQLPVVTRIYDPVKGIEPEPVTERYLELAGSLPTGDIANTHFYEVEKTLAELRELSLEIVDDNPFQRSGLETYRIRLFKGMEDHLIREGVLPNAGTEAEIVSGLFWSLEPDPDRLGPRRAFFESDLAPLLEANFFRFYDLDGELVDHFWILDLPFLLIFVVEFFVRWYLAIRRSTYPRWFFFPIFNWYDVLGIMPFKGMRLFRLFRIASIYIRLHRSEHSRIGDDPVSRTIKYFSNIVSEEISDMVSLRILNETQEELREGTHKQIIRSVAANHRDALAAQLALQMQELLTDNEVRHQARSFLDANLDRAVESSDSLRRLPLPDVVLRPLVATIGETVFDAFADTLAATLSSGEGQQAVADMIGDAIDGLVLEITEGELERVVREISIEVIGHMKETVAVRKWTLPDQPRQTIFTRDVID
jgi:hypothetical protein